MAVSKAQKAEIYAGLVELVKGAESIGFTTNNGLTVAEITSLRSEIRESNAKFVIAKKTLIKKAVKEVHGVEINDAEFTGQIGVVFSNEDPIAGLSAVNTEMKKLGEKMEWASSIFDGEFKGTEETKAIAGLPTKDTLLGRLVGSLMSPLSSFARFADAAAKEIEEQGKETLAQIEKKEESAE